MTVTELLWLLNAVEERAAELGVVGLGLFEEDLPPLPEPHAIKPKQTICNKTQRRKNLKWQLDISIVSKIN